MSEQRFIAIHGVKYHRIEDDEKGYVYYSEDAQSIDLLVGLLNEQQAIIQELERKLNKYAKIGEEQLKQIIELQEENEQLRKELKDIKENPINYF